MSEPHPEFGPPDGPPAVLPIDATDELLGSLGEFDAAHETMMDACASFAAEPTDDAFVAVASTAAKFSASFYEHMLAVTESPDIPLEEQSTIIFRLLIEKDSALVTMFRDLTTCEDFSAIEDIPEYREKLRKKVAKMARKAPGPIAFADDLLELHTQGLQEDLNHFARDVKCKKEGLPFHIDTEPLVTESQASSSESRGTRIRNVATTVGKHALDVGKIAAGVAAGLLAVQGWQRRRGRGS